MLNRNEIQKIKEKYRVGMRVRLLIMDDMQAPPIGTEGKPTYAAIKRYIKEK